MGRFKKVIEAEDGLDRRELGYYSTPDFISHFLTKKSLAINPYGTYALDPCVGNEEMIHDFYQSGIEIDGIDIHTHREYTLCNFKHDNFIEYYKKLKILDSFNQGINLKYDYYVANPPYNCHEINYIKDNKKILKHLFGNVGVHNMYSMFISAMIDCAKEGAIIAFISSDGFLTSQAHKSLREKILQTCSIHYLLLCPVNLFRKQKADVRTCIMILQKGKKFQKDVLVLNRPKNETLFHEALENESFTRLNLENILRKDINSEHQFVIGTSDAVHRLFSYPTLGENFKCVTGISTGNDSKFLSKEKTPSFSIPFFKNPGSKKFFCEPDAYLTDEYIRLDSEIKNFMVRNKKYMLQEGITCSSMGLPFSACYLPAGSTFGVNANIFCDPNDIWWLIAYLNSSLVTYFVRGVLTRSNMITSGYVSQIPIIPISLSAKEQLARVAKEAYLTKTSSTNKESVEVVDEIIFQELLLPEAEKSEIITFVNNLSSTV